MQPDDPTTPAAGEALTAESERLVRSLAGPPFNVVPPWLRLQLAAIEAAAAARALAARPGSARVERLTWYITQARAQCDEPGRGRLRTIRALLDSAKAALAAPDPATTPVGDTDRSTGDGSSTAVWYTPDCGHQHLATDPATVDLLRCPTPVERGCAWRPAYRTDECGLPEDHEIHHPERGNAGWYVHPYVAPTTPPAPAGRAEAER